MVSSLIFLWTKLNVAKRRDQVKRRGKKGPNSRDKVVNKKDIQQEQVESQLANSNNNYKICPFYYGVLKEATQNFSAKNFLGEGGFGDVHKGYVTYCTMNAAKPKEGFAIAVKRLIHCRPQGPEAWMVRFSSISVGSFFLSIYKPFGWSI